MPRKKRNPAKVRPRAWEKQVVIDHKKEYNKYETTRETTNEVIVSLRLSLYVTF